VIAQGRMPHGWRQVGQEDSAARWTLQEAKAEQRNSGSSQSLTATGLVVFYIPAIGNPNHGAVNRAGG